MSNESEPQYVKVEQPFGVLPPIVHCPICGQAMLGGELGMDGPTPCDHLSFIYPGALGEFDHQSEDFQSRVDESAIEDLSFENFRDFLKKAGYGNSMLAMEITYGGMACGPIWYTDVYGFDYGTLATE